MNVTSTPLSARVRFTYGPALSGFTFSNIRQNIMPAQLANLANALENLQAVPIQDVIFTTEAELRQA